MFHICAFLKIESILVSMESEVFNCLTIYLEHSVLATGGLSYLTVLARIMPTLKSWPVPKFISERQSLSLFYYVESTSATWCLFHPSSDTNLCGCFFDFLLSCLFSWCFLYLPVLNEFILLSYAFPVSLLILPFLECFFSWYNNSLSTHQLCYYDHNGLSL